MKTRSLHRLLSVLVVGLFALPAAAQFTRDASANAKIDEAINNHYLMMQLDQAENQLTGTVKACEDKCSPATKAKAWMYVGIVRGSGKNDQASAAEAFATAKGIDPNVQLDTALATPETKATFDATAGGAAPVAVTAAPVASNAPGAAPPPPGVPGDMLCSPQGAAIQTGMPIPISCTSDAAVASGFVKFQEPGGTDWKKVAFSNNGGQWQAEIPCTFTAKAGELKFYIGVKDAAGEYVDQFGSQKAPAVLTISDTGVAPAYPGQAPVTRCMDSSSDCPPDFPGCASAAAAQVCGDLDWGAACKNSTECKCGLLCEEGACATAPSCKVNEDCDTGNCVDGLCAATGGDGDKEAGPYKKHWLDLTVGMDFMPLGGENLCDPNEGFATSYGLRCYDGEGERVPVVGVNIKTGIAPGQLRIKAGYAYAITDHLLLGGKVGVGIMNSHPKEEGASFLPLHLEGRATYAFTSLGKQGIRPSLYVAGGFAEANAKLVANDTYVYKLAGRIFAAPGGKLEYMFAPNMGLGLDLQLMLLFPEGGMAIALHPALAFTYGL